MGGSPKIESCYLLRFELQTRDELKKRNRIVLILSLFEQFNQAKMIESSSSHLVCIYKIFRIRLQNKSNCALFIITKTFVFWRIYEKIDGNYWNIWNYSHWLLREAFDGKFPKNNIRLRDFQIPTGSLTCKWFSGFSKLSTYFGHVECVRACVWVWVWTLDQNKNKLL